MIKNTRASNVKSRAGCQTCKKRKVKCDETKPHCIRCLSSDRICEGYGIVIDIPSRPTDEELQFQIHREYGDSLPNIRPKPPILNTSLFLNHSETVTFDLFRSQIIFDMGGVRSLGFWQKIVLPACYSEPAILHASMALANASRWCRILRSNPRITGEGEDRMRLDTINDYNKAIQHLQTHVATNGNSSSLRIALIACVLFIALELSTGRLEQAGMHLDQGRKLLRTSTQFGTSTTEHLEVKTKTLILPPKSESIEDELVGIFADLDLQSTYFGSGRPQFTLSAYKPTDTNHSKPTFSFILPLDFQSIREANQYLVILINKCLQFVGQKLEFSLHSLQNELSNGHREHLRNSLKSWKTTYDKYCSKANNTEKSARTWRQQSAVMLIQHAWLSIIVPTSYFEIEETYFDNYLEEFTTITNLAFDILPEEGVSSGRFSLEFGWVIPLSWVVLKCRHPQIRRRALNLMQRAGREGLWEPKLVSQMGREYTLVEEGTENLDDLSLLNGEEFGHIEDWRSLIPLERRISIAHCIFEDSECTTLRMIFKRKVWDHGGRSTGMEEIIRLQPYEGSQTPL